MDEINQKINDYIIKEIRKRISKNNDAYKWIVNQIMYYENPEYSLNEYTENVLNKLKEIINMDLGDHPDVFLGLFYDFHQL